MADERRPGRFTEQAKAYLRDCTDDEAETVAATLDMINSGDLARLPTFESPLRRGLMVTLMSNGHLLAWRVFLDYRSRYEVTYLGDGSDF